MWNQIPRASEERREGRDKIVAVAIDKDKSSQYALKWATDHILSRGDTVKLIHVIQRPLSNPTPPPGDGEEVVKHPHDNQTMEVFLPYRCFCMRRHIQCELVVLERPDVARALIEYVSQYGVETLLLGAPSKNGLTSMHRLFKAADIPATVLKWVPDFCNVYIVSKGKCNAVRTATRPVPLVPNPETPRTPRTPRNFLPELPTVIKSYDEFSATPEADISFTSSGRTSTDSTYFSFYENLGLITPRVHSLMEGNRNFELTSSESTSPTDDLADFSELPFSELPSNSLDSGGTSPSSQNLEDMDDEMRRLKSELKQTIEMYHSVSNEAQTAKQKVIELERWKAKEEGRIREAEAAGEKDKAELKEAMEARIEEADQVAEEKAKAKYKTAMEAAESAQKMIEVEMQKRVNAEMKALKEAEEKTRVLYALGQSHIVLKYQSLFHLFIVLFSFYLYFSVFGRNF